MIDLYPGDVLNIFDGTATNTDCKVAIGGVIGPVYRGQCPATAGAGIYTVPGGIPLFQGPFQADVVAHNTGGSAVTVTVNVTCAARTPSGGSIAASTFIEAKAILQTKETLYVDRTGTYVVDANGNRKTSVAAVNGAVTPQSLTLPQGASTAAAGSTTSDAGVLPSSGGTTLVLPTTAADDTKGVRIAAADKVTGRLLLIANGVANKILKVYGPSGATINAGSADAAFSSVSGKGVFVYCIDSTLNTWFAW